MNEKNYLARIYEEALNGLILRLSHSLTYAEDAQNSLKAGDYKDFFLNIHAMPNFVREGLDKMLQAETASWDPKNLDLFKAE